MPIERVTPVFQEHPAFNTPEEGASLWRYMDFARFVALLERRALFFSSIRAFPDRFEGSLTPQLINELQAKGPTALRDWRNWPFATYVNCWNQDQAESVALWSMYTSPAGGVAVRSSLSSILGALEPDTSDLDPPDSVHVGQVRYVDYKKQSIPSDNAFWPLLHKRLPYRFEHEVRLALWPQRLLQLSEKRNPKDPVGAAAQIAPPGYDVAIDPDLLIEAVVIAPEAPDWLVELVRAVGQRYRLSAPVMRSDLDSEPA